MTLIFPLFPEDALFQCIFPPILFSSDDAPVYSEHSCAMQNCPAAGCAVGHSLVNGSARQSLLTDSHFSLNIFIQIPAAGTAIHYPPGKGPAHLLMPGSLNEAQPKKTNAEEQTTLMISIISWHHLGTGRKYL